MADLAGQAAGSPQQGALGDDRHRDARPDAQVREAGVRVARLGDEPERGGARIMLDEGRRAQRLAHQLGQRQLAAAQVDPELHDAASAIDAAGHGDSDCRGGATSEDHAAQLRDLRLERARGESHPAVEDRAMVVDQQRRDLAAADVEAENRSGHRAPPAGASSSSAASSSPVSRSRSDASEAVSSRAAL